MDLEISVGNCYTENRLMHTFYDNFYQGGHYSDQIASHQEYLRTEETSLIKMFIHIWLLNILFDFRQFSKKYWERIFGSIKVQ